jgi:MOSC domain-containing protein YiiM
MNRSSSAVATLLLKRAPQGFYAVIDRFLGRRIADRLRLVWSCGRVEALPAIEQSSIGRLAAISIGRGAPKREVTSAHVTGLGLEGDARLHRDHERLDRAISLLDMETIETFRHAGFAIQPGTFGENLVIQGISTKQLSAGSSLQIGTVVIELARPWQPCALIWRIDHRLHEVSSEPIGWLASVVRAGELAPGAEVVCDSP